MCYICPQKLQHGIFRITVVGNCIWISLFSLRTLALYWIPDAEKIDIRYSDLHYLSRVFHNAAGLPLPFVLLLGFHYFCLVFAVLYSFIVFGATVKVPLCRGFSLSMCNFIIVCIM